MLVEYRDSPTVEWTLDFRNTADARLLEAIQPLGASIRSVGEVVLHHNVAASIRPPPMSSVDGRADPGVGSPGASAAARRVQASQRPAAVVLVYAKETS